MIPANLFGLGYTSFHGTSDQRIAIAAAAAAWAQRATVAADDAAAATASEQARAAAATASMAKPRTGLSAGRVASLAAKEARRAEDAAATARATRMAHARLDWAAWIADVNSNGWSDDAYDALLALIASSPAT